MRHAAGKETPIPKKLLKSAQILVEMRRLELLTPYMRSEKAVGTGRNRKGRKRKKS
jgi:hypothetical protein